MLWFMGYGNDNVSMANAISIQSMKKHERRTFYRSLFDFFFLLLLYSIFYFGTFRKFVGFSLFPIIMTTFWFKTITAFRWNRHGSVFKHWKTNSKPKTNPNFHRIVSIRHKDRPMVKKL